MSSESASLTILSMTQAIASFTTFMPRITEVRKASKTDADTATDVRMGEIAAVTTTLAVAAVTSSIGQSSMPMVIAVIMCLVMFVLYESALTRPSIYEQNAVIRDA